MYFDNNVVVINKLFENFKANDSSEDVCYDSGRNIDENRKWPGNQTIKF